MKIVIAEGRHEADYIIKLFRSRKNQIIVINSDKEFGKEIAKNNKIPVIFGKSSNIEILKLAHIENADVLISLHEQDTVDFVTCLLAKQLFNVKKTICTVTNPKLVDLFKELGVDSVISSSYVLGNSVKAESSLEDLIKTMSLEDDKIVMTEITISENSKIANKKIMELNFPKFGNISCVYRKPNVIIPNGQTIILPNDKLLVVSALRDQKKIIDFVSEESKETIESTPSINEPVEAPKPVTKTETDEPAKVSSKPKSNAFVGSSNKISKQKVEKTPDKKASKTKK